MNDLQKLLKIDGFDDAIVGIGLSGNDSVIIYDHDLMLDHLVKDGMTQEEAADYIDFNIIGVHINGGAMPIILYRMPPEAALGYAGGIAEEIENTK